MIVKRILVIILFPIWIVFATMFYLSYMFQKGKLPYWQFIICIWPHKHNCINGKLDEHDELWYHCSFPGCNMISRNKQIYD